MRQAWCNTTGNRLVYKSEDKGKYTVVIEKGSSDTCTVLAAGGGRAKTLIMFMRLTWTRRWRPSCWPTARQPPGPESVDILTFWGLNVIKKTAKPKVKKDIFGRMFGMMLPSVVAEAPPLEDEYAGDRRPDDAPHHEKQGDRLARISTPASYR